MSETITVTVIGVIASLVTFFLGKRTEQQKQLALSRQSLLEPISSWLSGAEKMSGIVADTASTIILGQRTPMNYDFRERRDASRFMNEQTNQVIGILESNTLKTRRTAMAAEKLKANVLEIDKLIKFHLLRLENALLEAANKSQPIDALFTELTEVSSGLQKLLRDSHGLIARLKTTFEE